MQRRPQTGGTIQSYMQKFNETNQQWVTPQQVHNQNKKNKMFVPTLKIKRQDQRIQSSARMIQSSKGRPLISQQQRQQTVDLNKINISHIKDSQDQELNQTIKDLTDQLTGNYEKNNFFEKNILESTQPQSEEQEPELVYQENPMNNFYQDTKINPMIQNLKNIYQTEQPQQINVKENTYKEDIKSFQRKRIMMTSARLHETKRAYSSSIKKDTTSKTNQKQTQNKPLGPLYKQIQNETSSRNQNFSNKIDNTNINIKRIKNINIPKQFSNLMYRKF